MTPDEEMHLYQTNRNAWFEWAAPRMAKMIMKRSDEWLDETWPMISKDYKTEIWKHLDRAQRERVRRVRRDAA